MFWFNNFGYSVWGLTWFMHGSPDAFGYVRLADLTFWLKKATIFFQMNVSINY